MDNVLIVSVIGTAAGAALVTGLFNLLSDHLKRRADKRAGTVTLEDIKRSMDGIADTVSKQGRAQRVIMFDRLNYLIERCIRERCVPYGLRQDVNALYESYKHDLAANGDLESLMVIFRQLPIEEGTHEEKA